MNKTYLTLACLALSACAVGPDYQRPSTPLPAVYSTTAERAGGSQQVVAATTDSRQEAVPGSSSSQTLTMTTLQADWWTLYQDPTLNQLIAQAQRNNRDLQQAVARVEEADALMREAGAALLPEIDVGANASRSRISQVGSTPLFGASPLRNSFQMALSTSFELDFWGRLRRTREAARAQALGTLYAKEVTAITLAGAVAQSYFTLRSLDMQLSLTQQNLQARQDTLNLVVKRNQAGLVSDLDLRQAESARADLAASLKDVQRQRELAEHQLAALTGQPGSQVNALPQPVLPVAPQPPVGLPSSLVDQRPDVRQAEQALVSANAQIGVAKAAQYPSFSLTGTLGGQSRELSDLFTAPARIWSLGLGATMPVLDFGRYSARTQQAEARQKQALAVYQKTVETAFREVADALTANTQYAAAQADMVQRAQAAKETLRLAMLRYQAGYAGYLEVLDAQRTANDAELALVRQKTARLLASVDLIKALGGGWQAAR